MASHKLSRSLSFAKIPTTLNPRTTTTGRRRGFAANVRVSNAAAATVSDFEVGSSSADGGKLRESGRRGLAGEDGDGSVGRRSRSVLLRDVARARLVERDSRSVSPALTDTFGRKHDYLRISLTEKCNLRCTYCMPADGVPLSPSSNLLTTPEIVRIASLFVRNGVKKIRLTGGEPTIRKDIEEVISRLSALGLDSLGMTSNGLALHRKLPRLVEAGLTNLNLSLDTLDEMKFELITRRRGFGAVMSSLEKAQSLQIPPDSPKEMKGLRSVKLNVVIIRGLNDSEFMDFVELTRDRDVEIRAIEYMPFEDNKWSTRKLVPSSELLSQIRTRHPDIEPLTGEISDTARIWRVPGYKGTVGFISSMTDHFCAGCSRLRVGSDGGLKVCLFGAPALQLRPLVRDPLSTDQDILRAIDGTVKGKKWAHDGSKGPSEIAKNAKHGPMVLIGDRTRLRSKSKPATSLLLPYQFDSPSRLQNQRSLFSTSTRHLKNDNKPSSGVVPHQTSPELTHFDPSTGKPRMVSVTGKPPSVRSATARGTVWINGDALNLIQGRNVAAKAKVKGDVLSVAQLAGIMGAKQTSSLIPLCHPINLTHVDVQLKIVNPSSSPHPADSDSDERPKIEITATATCVGSTGVEMEALTAVNVAALTVWDMLKSVAGREMEIGEVRVVGKSGGKSGDWQRE